MRKRSCPLLGSSPLLGTGDGLFVHVIEINYLKDSAVLLMQIRKLRLQDVTNLLKGTQSVQYMAAHLGLLCFPLNCAASHYGQEDDNSELVLITGKGGRLAQVGTSGRQ